MTLVSIDDEARMKVDFILQYFMRRSLTPFDQEMIRTKCRAICFDSVVAGSWSSARVTFCRATLYRQCGCFEELAQVDAALDAAHKVNLPNF
jgi:hypothetical protein